MIAILRMARAHSLLLAAAAVLCYQLFVPPIVGLANNSDFSKVLGIFRLAGPRADENAYISPA